MKDRKLITCILVALLGTGACFSLRAAEGRENNAKPPAPEGTGAKGIKRSSDQRPEGAKKLTPEQREERKKEHLDEVESKLKELQLKETTGALTPAEAKQLANLQKQLEQLEKQKKAQQQQPPKKAHPKPAGTNNGQKKAHAQ